MSALLHTGRRVYMLLLVQRALPSPFVTPFPDAGVEPKSDQLWLFDSPVDTGTYWWGPQSPEMPPPPGVTLLQCRSRQTVDYFHDSVTAQQAAKVKGLSMSPSHGTGLLAVCTNEVRMYSCGDGAIVWSIDGLRGGKDCRRLQLFHLHQGD